MPDLLTTNRADESGRQVRLKGSDFLRAVRSESKPVVFAETEGQIWIESGLDADEFDLAYLTDTRIDVTSLLMEEKLPVQFWYKGLLKVNCVLNCYDRNAQRLGAVYPKLNAVGRVPKEANKK